jgi:hypothetical protein
MSLDITTSNNGAKIGKIDIETMGGFFMRAEGCVMQERYLTWDEHKKMRKDGRPVLLLQFIGSMDLHREGPTLKIWCERKPGYKWHVRELLAACCLSNPDFFKGLEDAYIVLEENNPDSSETKDDLVFPDAKGPQCIPRDHVLGKARVKDTDYGQAYQAVLDLLCEEK